MNRLKKAIQWDYQHIPYFIDTNSYNDKVVWDNIQRIIRIIGFMCGGKILSATFIETYNDKCQELIDVIVSISSDQLAIETEYYLSGLIDSYLEVCIEDELYEAATNLRNFKCLYKIVK